MTNKVKVNLEDLCSVLPHGDQFNTSYCQIIEKNGNHWLIFDHDWSEETVYEEIGKFFWGRMTELRKDVR